MRERGFVGGLLATLVLLLAAAPPAGAAVDYFLKLGDIKGESTDERHREEIEINSFSWGLTQAGGQGSGARQSGKVNVQDMSFVKALDRSSPKLVLAAASGQRIPCATLTAREPEGEPVMGVVLENVVVSGYSVSGSEGDVVPTDSFSLNFTKIQYGVGSRSEDGARQPTVVAWDFLTREQFTPKGSC